MTVMTLMIARVHERSIINYWYGTNIVHVHMHVNAELKTNRIRKKQGVNGVYVGMWASQIMLMGILSSSSSSYSG